MVSLTLAMYAKNPEKCFIFIDFDENSSPLNKLSELINGHPSVKPIPNQSRVDPIADALLDFKENKDPEETVLVMSNSHLWSELQYRFWVSVRMKRSLTTFDSDSGIGIHSWHNILNFGRSESLDSRLPGNYFISDDNPAKKFEKQLGFNEELTFPRVGNDDELESIFLKIKERNQK